MEGLTLNQLTKLASVKVKRLQVYSGLEDDLVIDDVNYSMLKKYGDYQVVAISTFMESAYSEHFKTMTVECGICVSLCKECAQEE